jgi:hypothetical protein
MEVLKITAGFFAIYANPRFHWLLNSWATILPLRKPSRIAFSRFNLPDSKETPLNTKPDIKKKSLQFMPRRTRFKFAGVTTLILTTAGLAGASPIVNLGTGSLNAGNGSVIVSGNGVTSGCINWYTTTAPTLCPDTGVTSTLTVSGGSGSPFTPGETGTIQDLSFQTALPLVDFLVINRPSMPSLQFDLLDIRTNTGAAIGSCTGSAATSQDVSCTPAASPFTISNGPDDPNNGNSVDTATVSFTVDAWGYVTNSGTNYNAANLYVGTFTTQQAISNATIASILAVIQSGGAVTASWSATFAPETVTAGSITPEPASFLFLGIGLTVIGLYKRKTRKA